MKTNKQLLQVAIGQLGKGGQKYRTFAGITSGPWCESFVYWLFNANGCGTLLPWKGTQKTYCPDGIKWCNKNLALIPPYIALPCDIIYFDWEKNGRPNHVGIVESKVSTGAIKTIEGNTSGSKVDRKKRDTKYVQGVYRPHFAPAGLKKAKLSVDSVMGYKTIYMLQYVLGVKQDGILGQQTVRALQKAAGAKQDGQFGPATARKVQAMTGAKQDGEYGPNSVKKLQEWINAKAFPSTKPAVTKTTNAQKLVNSMKALAWAYGTAKKKYAYKTGAPKAACKTAMKKYGYKTKEKWSSCAYFANTVVRETGINKNVGWLHGYKKPFSKAEAGFNLVWSGKAIPDGFLKAGDVIRYKKTNKDEHVMFYFGDGKICDAGHYNRFGNIRKNDHRYNGSKVKKNTIQVFRAKE